MKILATVKSVVLFALLFLFPLFFLPTTQEFYTTNKLYLLAFGSLLLLAISAIEFLISRKFVWRKGTFDSGVLLFVMAVALSTIISSPNKVQALLNPNFGLVSITSLSFLYFYLTRRDEKEKSDMLFSLLSLSAVIVSVLTLIFFFNPFGSVSLPVSLAFFKNVQFTPLGGFLDLAVFLGFFVALSFSRLLTIKRQEGGRHPLALLAAFGSFTLLLCGFSLAVYGIVKPPAGVGLTLPPFSVSWYAAVDVLKSPLSALFGVGVDNYASIFALSKNVLYNQSSLWQIQSFNVSRSTLLHVFSETGILGLIAFILLALSILKEVSRHGRSLKTSLPVLLPVGYLFLVALLLPPSLTFFFLVFMVLVSLNRRSESEYAGTNTDVANILPVYLGILLFAIFFIGGAAYFLSRGYVAEYSFRKSIEGLIRNNFKDLYDNQRNAVVLDPYIERFRVNFAQTNLQYAINTSAQLAQTKPPVAGQAEDPQLAAQREVVAQAIQAAIAESKAAVALNSQKAVNWENLANVYRSVLNVAQGADVWTISSYQRAIVLDPQNPLYRIGLGGVYYSLQNYEEAVKMFEQGVLLKQDWANAHYNLAWASYQRGDYPRAANEMQNVLSLINPTQDKADFERASKELVEFKKKLPKEEASATESAVPQQTQKLALPTPPIATVSPRIQLPKDAAAP